MKWLKRIAAISGALLAVLALVPFFVTLDDSIPAIEKEMSAILGAPVSIEHVRVAVLPVPHARIEGVTVGVSEDIRIRKVSVTPSLWSLLRTDKVIRSIDVNGLVLSQKAFATLAALTQRETTTSSIRVEKIRLEDTTLKLETASFGPFDLQVRMSNGADKGELVLKTHDGALQARAVPDSGRYVLEVKARSWVSPIGPAVRFDSLDVKGVIAGKVAEIAEINSRAYNGTLSGGMIVRWDKGVSLRGQLNLKQIDVKAAAALVSRNTQVSGRLDARPVFRARSESFGELADALRIETPFTIHDGVLHGFDLMSAATTFGRQGTSEGQTRFDELAGYLTVERGAYRFTKLRIASGALSATGHVTISPSKALSGQLSTSVKGLGRATSIPLAVAGTVESPLVFPNTSALAGAAAGTVLLGPGVGTAAGAKLGEFVSDLFGKKAP